MGRPHLRSVFALGITSRRHYATKYTAKITSTSPTGRTLSAEVSPPQSLPYDARGYPIPRRHLICKATQILLQSPTTSTSRRPPQLDPTNPTNDPLVSLQSYLSSLPLHPPFTHLEISEILKSLNLPSLALRFFRFCPSLLSPSFRHDALTYNRIILLLSKSTLPNKLPLIRELLSEMEQSGTRGSISTVNILIGVFLDNTDLDWCVGLVKKWDLKMTGYTYKCLVQAYLRSRDCQKGYEVYLRMKTKGHALDIFAYNMLLDSLAKDHKHYGRLIRRTRFLKT